MLSVNISKSITQCCQNVVLGLLQCRVSVYTKDADFAALFQNKIAELAETELSQANKRDTIQSTRKAYKALGKDPNRYRCSAEAMCRRIAKERGLYDINNVVDITNFLSIASGYSMGTYDVAKITGDIVWKRAEEGTAYQGIGKEIKNLQKQGVTEKALHVTKEQMISNFIIGSESTLNRMTSAGAALLLRDDVQTIEEVIAKIEAVTLEDMAKVMDLIFANDDFSYAVVGNENRADITNAIQEFLS